jgi:biotin transport system substrate-specific component
MIGIHAISSKENSKILNSFNFIAIAFLASFLISIFGKVRIFLPFTPVPIVLQMQLIFLLSFLLGPKKGALAVLLFIFQAGVGLPVLPSDLFFTFTKGYYIGYFFAAIIVGFLARDKRDYMGAFAILCLGSLIVYLFGLLFFSFYVGIKSAFILGVLPFIIPDLIKNMIVVQFLKKIEWASKTLPLVTEKSVF